jgi:iron complex outermembrane receptor protein
LTSQVLVAGDRSRAFDDGVDSFRIEGYTTVDLGASYDTRVGRLELQVLNLFDNFYLPVESQSRFGNTANRRFAAPGRTLALTWSQAF